MAKGYWIVRLDITQLEPFQAYIAANGAVLAQYGAQYLARAGNHTVPEGNPARVTPSFNSQATKPRSIAITPYRIKTPKRYATARVKLIW